MGDGVRDGVGRRAGNVACFVVDGGSVDWVDVMSG